MDMVEWDIKTTSNHCPHIQNIYTFEEEIVGYECSHWDNSTKDCSKINCPILIKTKCAACQGRGLLLAPDDVAETCHYCKGTGVKK